jgi:hypothetical protein
MNKIYVPTKTPEDWKALLAEPNKQWKDNYSAKELACCWEKANGFPESVKKTFNNSGIAIFEKAELLFAFPEYKVPLPGGERSSQNDIYVIAKGDGNLISIMVEGKVEESFDKTISEWNNEASLNSGKPERLRYLLNKLSLTNNQVQKIRYQLLHRAVSAIIEAEKLGTKNALILIHSFSKSDNHFTDFDQFVKLFGLSAVKNSIVGPYQTNGINVFFGWVCGRTQNPV